MAYSIVNIYFTKHLNTVSTFLSDISLNVQDFLECFPKFRVENRVDERIDARVDVTQPRGHYEGCVTRIPAQLKFDANRVDDIAREKRHPAHQKNS